MWETCGRRRWVVQSGTVSWLHESLPRAGNLHFGLVEGNPPRKACRLVPADETAGDAGSSAANSVEEVVSVKAVTSCPERASVSQECLGVRLALYGESSGPLSCCSVVTSSIFQV